jgi:hypothetical protein
MIYWMLGVIVALVLLSALMKAWREARARRKKIVIHSPKIGMFNLLGGSAEEFIGQDRKCLEALFGDAEVADSAPPQCDVLFIYCNVKSEGQIENYGDGLRELIRDSNAKIVVVATENPTENYTAAALQKGYGQANLVMTRNRKGEMFDLFFERLFRKMKQGSTMPLAWDELAPQRPGKTHKKCPGTIFLCEAGHLSFS